MTCDVKGGKNNFGVNSFAAGTFQNPQHFTAGFGLRGLAVADINRNGRPDLVTADEFFDEVAVLLQQ